MIKKLLLLLTAVLCLATPQTKAQTANRSGFFIDLQGGQNIGYAYRIKDYVREEYGKDWYLKGGAEIGLGFGYRLRTSNHWAYEAKLAFQENLSATKLFNIGVMTGMRYTSNNFGSGQSFYIAPNVGFSAIIDDFGIYIPVELGAGINLSNKLSLGIVCTYRIATEHTYSTEFIGAENVDYWWSNWAEAMVKSNLVTSLRLSYRF